MYLKIYIIILVFFCQNVLIYAIYKKFSRSKILKRAGDTLSLNENKSDPVYRDPLFTLDLPFNSRSAPAKTSKNRTWNIPESSQKISEILPFSCAAVMGNKGSPGPYLINVKSSKLDPFFVYCERDPKGGAPWTVIQRRVNGLIDFNRCWSEYREGFGHIQADFWMGLKRIHALTTAARHELWIEMEDWQNISSSAMYSSFAIGDEDQLYVLNVLGSYSGNTGDSLLAHAGQKFSTIDRDNDSFPEASCAIQFKGGWWFRACYKSFLNGYYVTPDKASVQNGIKWNSWHGDTYSLYFVQMAIRPVQ